MLLDNIQLRILKLTAPKRARSFRRLLRSQEAASLLTKSRGEAQSGPLIVVGFFKGTAGLSVSGRRLVRALRTAGFKLHTVDVTEQFGLRAIVPWIDDPPPSNTGGSVIFCINPIEVALFLLRGGLELIRNRKLIGYWFWELETLPYTWIPLANLFDEFWCASRFIYDAFAKGFPHKAIRYLPVSIEMPAISNKSLGDLGLREDCFTVASIFDFRSFSTRKNPFGMLRAFQDAFKNRTDVQYVIKASGTDFKPPEVEKFRQIAAETGNVSIIDKVLDTSDINALIAHADTILSLHRSEGFGMVPAEAMMLGTPVIATGWSGVLDFLNPSNSGLIGYEFISVGPYDYPDVPKDSRWAAPRHREAVGWLQNLKEDRNIQETLAVAAKQSANDLFSPETFARYAARLND